MKNVLKKILCIGTAAAIALPSSCLGVFAADTAAGAKAEKSFFEDFEKYQITEYESSSMIVNGRPTDGDYSNTTVYPNGTGSVYEGNAMNNIAVKDANNHDVYGGLDGWYGFYNGAKANYYTGNRRLTVGNYAAAGDVDNDVRVNTSQTLKLEPHSTSDATASLNRNNVDISNYSFLSSRVSLSGTDNFGKAGIALTVNPESTPNTDNTDMKYDSVYDLVTFESGATSRTIDIKFNSNTLANIALSTFGSGNKNTPATWYTVEIRLMNNPTEMKAKVDIYNDNNDTKLYGTDWVALDGFNYDYANKYGIRFYAQSKANTAADGETSTAAQPRMLLDDVKFTKDNFREDFESYSVTEKLQQYVGIINGAKGNLNDTDTYTTDGVVYEGNMARNNNQGTYKRTGVAGSYKNTAIYGHVPFWQGYISTVDSKDAHSSSDANQRTCAIVGNAYGKFKGNQVLQLFSKVAAGTTYAKSIYAGMDNCDFDGNTELKAKFVIPEVSTANAETTFKFQLTSGREKTTADIATSSDGTVIAPATEYKDKLKSYDVLTVKDGAVYFGNDTSKKIADFTYASNTLYEMTYVIDRSGDVPKHKLILTKSDYNTTETVYSGDFEEMTFAADGFAFDKNVTGFRYVATTEGKSNTGTVQLRAWIDDIEINKYFSNEVANSGISAVRIDKSTKGLNAIVNMPEECSSQIIAVIYNADGNMVSVGYAEATDSKIGYNPTSLTLSSVPSDFETGDYTVRLFCWDGLTSLKPIMAEYTLR